MQTPFRFTVWAVEHDPDTNSSEAFDCGGSNDSLEATFLARNEAEDNPAASYTYVTDGPSEIIYIIDPVLDRSGYVGKRDGSPITSWAEAATLAHYLTV